MCRGFLASFGMIVKRKQGAFGQKGWFFILLSPLLAIVLVGLLWIYTEEKVDSARETAEKTARSLAAASADSYAQQLGHMAAQIDQITIRLKYSWEDPEVGVHLEKDKMYGLFPESQLLYANIFDRNGNIVSSTVNVEKRKKINISQLSYFQFQKTECCAGLLITPPSNSLLLGRPIVRFVRRLNRADGSFDGVVSVSVEPLYLVTFQENSVRGEKDFVSARLTSGELLASKVGQKASNDFPVFYRTPPIFWTASGVLREPAERFRDKEARFVAWKKLDKYPIVAIAAFSETDALAPFREQAQGYRDTAILGTALLLVLSMITVNFAMGYVKRRRQAEETQETYRLATDAANEGFYMIRPIYGSDGAVMDFRLDDLNNRGAELIGTTRDQLLGSRASALTSGTFRDELVTLCHRAMEKGFLEEEIRVSSRSVLKAKWVYRRIVSSHAGLALTIRDISAAKEQEQILADLANTDALTKLPNRNWLNTFLPAAISQAFKRAGHLAVLFIDLDNFKNVNDTLGHEAGDELLVQASERLRKAVRASDHVARLGGDEFVVILDYVEQVEYVAKVAGTIIESIGKPFQLEAGTGNEIRASVGVSVFPEDGRDSETLLKHADIAMYAAKAAGKGRYVFYRTHLSDSLILRLDKERALREAIRQDEFVVHYQPRVGLKSGQLTSMEALVRWMRPDHGLVYPSEFIDVAEDMGIIIALGEAVIEKVCRQIAEWKVQGLPMVPVSVNVSPQQLKSGSLSKYVAACLARHRIDASMIEVELVESAVIDRSQIVSAELAALRALGIKLMIDDFGTGYSSMAQLHRLDVDVLKVDKAFTNALTDGSEGKLLFGAIMSMASALEISVVAEGVETVEQLDMLQALSCDEIQGHLVSKAVSAKEMAVLIGRRSLLAQPRGAGRLVPV